LLSVAGLATEHGVIITLGNGAQVGLLALQAASSTSVQPYPLDVLGAESEGMIGYLLEQGLTNALPERAVATLLTQVIVDPLDPAFRPADEADRPRLRGAGGEAPRCRAGLGDRSGRALLPARRPLARAGSDRRA